MLEIIHDSFIESINDGSVKLLFINGKFIGQDFDASYLFEKAIHIGESKDTFRALITTAKGVPLCRMGVYNG